MNFPIASNVSDFNLGQTQYVGLRLSSNASVRTAAWLGGHLRRSEADGMVPSPVSPTPDCAPVPKLFVYFFSSDPKNTRQIRKVLSFGKEYLGAVGEENGRRGNAPLVVNFEGRPP